MMNSITALFRKIINCPHSDHVVYKDTCEATHEGITARIDDLKGHIDQQKTTYDEYLENENMQERRKRLY